MLSNFRKHLENTLPFLEGKRLLLAVSGGLDSMVMTHLFLSLGYKVALAHCNFKLRGEESDGDEVFVREFAADKQVRANVTKFDTQAFAADRKLSIQVAARQLRYSWFNDLVEKEGYDYILTAHHLDDAMETFLINLTRGTGLAGLTGIPEQNGKIVRPLLPFSRAALMEYAVANGISWREDSSNSSTKYLRNKLRHDVIPVLKSVNPNFEETFAETLLHLREVNSMADDASAIVYKEVVKDLPGQKIILLSQLLRLPNFRAYLYHWLSPLGFTAWDDTYRLVNAQSGKIVMAPDYMLLKDRNTLILQQRNQAEDTDKRYEIAREARLITQPVNLHISATEKVDKDTLKNVLFADEERLKFPLFVRRWQHGDWFCPNGMNGQKKKLSKFFKDEKFSVIEKEKVWLLCSGDDVVWIIGHRSDHRFTANNSTHKIVKIEVLQ